MLNVGDGLCLLATQRGNPHVEPCDRLNHDNLLAMAASHNQDYRWGDSGELQHQGPKINQPSRHINGKLRLLNLAPLTALETVAVMSTRCLPSPRQGPSPHLRPQPASHHHRERSGVLVIGRVARQYVTAYSSAIHPEVCRLQVIFRRQPLSVVDRFSTSQQQRLRLFLRSDRKTSGP
jgi:hypothetical protein